MSQEVIACTCPKCKRNYRVRLELRGKRIACKACGSPFVVQDGSGDSDAPANPGASEESAAAPESTAEVTIPLDDAPIPLDDSSSPGAGIAGETRITVEAEEKVEITATGHYLVAKILLTGKMMHVAIEKSLNEYAAQGWRVQHMFAVGQEAFAVMTRADDNGGEDSAGDEPE